MVRYPSTTAYPFNILMPVVAYNGPSDAPEPLFTSDFLHCYRYNAVARVESAEKTSLAKLGNFAEFANTTCIFPVTKISMHGITTCAITPTSSQHELMK